MIRALLAAAAALTAVAAVLGFGVSRSLSAEGAADFATAMDQAIADPAVQQEVQAELRSRILLAGEDLAAQAGPLAGIARSGAGQLADQVVGVVPTQRFRSAWQEWSDVLYSGLAATAVGDPDPDVRVIGDSLTVALGPLLTPLTGETLAGGVIGALGALGRDANLTVTTSVDLQRLLTSAGWLAEWAWLLAVVALVLLLAVVAMGRRRLGWLAGTLLLSAGLCALVAFALGRIPTDPESTLPELSGLVIETLTEPWRDTSARAALGFAIAGLVALAVAVVVSPRRVASGGDAATTAENSTGH